MTNAAIQALIAQSPEGGVFAIKFDNGETLFIDYPGGVKIENISFETIGEVEFVVVKRKVRDGNHDLEYKIYHETACAQWIGVMEPGYEEFRPDPYRLD